MKMIRISEESSAQLDQLSLEMGKAKQDLLARAIEMLVVDYFFDKANKAYADLKKNPKAWEAEKEERALWEATSRDGLKDDEDDY